METIRQFTPEQEDRIAELREATAAERKENAKVLERRTNLESRTIKVGSKVRVNKNSVTIIGHVLNVKDGNYTVSTPQGIIKDVTSSEIQLRYVGDYSNVIIPEALKAFTTKELVEHIQDYSRCHHDDNYYRHSALDKFHECEIRAELMLRPNIKKAPKKLRKLIRSQK